MRSRVKTATSSAARGYAVLVTKSHLDGPRPWLLTTGYVTTPLGIVGVVVAETRDEPRDNDTRLTFVWRGQIHVRRLNRVLTERGVITVAGRFAREIAGGADA